MLLQDGRHICLRNVIEKGTISKNNSRFTGWIFLSVPANDTEGYRFCFARFYLSSKTDKQCTGA
jgi:hypothetical protein